LGVGEVAWSWEKRTGLRAAVLEFGVPEEKIQEMSECLSTTRQMRMITQNQNGDSSRSLSRVPTRFYMFMKPLPSARSLFLKDTRTRLSVVISSAAQFAAAAESSFPSIPILERVLIQASVLHNAMQRNATQLPSPPHCFPISTHRIAFDPIRSTPIRSPGTS